jgi:hypothetical protein
MLRNCEKELPLGDGPIVGYNAAQLCAVRGTTEDIMASCDHLCNTEEQLRDLLGVINDHLKLHDTDEEAYSSLLAVAFHINEALHELSYLLDQAEEVDVENTQKEVGH